MGSQRSPGSGTPTALGAILEETRRTTQARARVGLDRTAWRHAVGRRIAERTEVGAIKAKELTIYVASAAWAQELSLLTSEIVERIRAQGVDVERLRFRIRSELKAPAHARKEPTRPPPRPLPSELAARLQRIGDDELRQAIAEAAGLALTRLHAEQTTSKQPSARTPRGAATRTAPPGRSSVAGPAAAPGKRAKSRG